jgi:hypothetical protein
VLGTAELVEFSLFSAFIKTARILRVMHLSQVLLSAGKPILNEKFYDISWSLGSNSGYYREVSHSLVLLNSFKFKKHNALILF